MPVCPKCGEEIDYLINVCEKTVCFEFTVNKNGFPEYSLDGETDNYAEGTYECPECYETLFSNEDDAKEFLTQKVEQQSLTTLYKAKNLE